MIDSLIMHNSLDAVAAIADKRELRSPHVSIKETSLQKKKKKKIIR